MCSPLHLAQEPIFVLLLPPKRSTVPIRRVAATLEEAGKATAEQQLAKSVFPVRGEHCPPDHSPSIPFFERFLNVGSSFPCE